MENIEEHLAEAIEENNADEVEKLLSVGKQINWTKEDQFGQCLLHRAAEVGSATVVLLILKKIDAEALWGITDANGSTAVHFAVLSGNADNVAAIVKHSPKYARSIIAALRHVPISQSLVRIVQVADNSGGLPIHWAAMHGCENAVLEALVGSDGNPELVNRQDDSGMSPLHHAASMNRVAAGLWLLQHGADKKLEDHSSRTPRDVAEQRSYIDFISMMDTHL